MPYQFCSKKGRLLALLACIHHIIYLIEGVSIYDPIPCLESNIPPTLDWKTINESIKKLGPGEELTVIDHQHGTSFGYIPGSEAGYDQYVVLPTTRLAKHQFKVAIDDKSQGAKPTPTYRLLGQELKLGHLVLKKQDGLKNSLDLAQTSHPEAYSNLAPKPPQTLSTASTAAQTTLRADASPFIPCKLKLKGQAKALSVKNTYKESAASAIKPHEDPTRHPAATLAKAWPDCALSDGVSNAIDEKLPTHPLMGADENGERRQEFLQKTCVASSMKLHSSQPRFRYRPNRNSLRRKFNAREPIFRILGASRDGPYQAESKHTTDSGSALGEGKNAVRGKEKQEISEYLRDYNSPKSCSNRQQKSDDDVRNSNGWTSEGNETNFLPAQVRKIERANQKPGPEDSKSLATLNQPEAPQTNASLKEHGVATIVSGLDYKSALLKKPNNTSKENLKQRISSPVVNCSSLGASNHEQKKSSNSKIQDVPVSEVDQTIPTLKVKSEINVVFPAQTEMIDLINQKDLPENSKQQATLNKSSALKTNQNKVLAFHNPEFNEIQESGNDLISAEKNVSKEEGKQEGMISNHAQDYDSQKASMHDKNKLSASKSSNEPVSDGNQTISASEFQTGAHSAGDIESTTNTSGISYKSVLLKKISISDISQKKTNLEKKIEKANPYPKMFKPDNHNINQETSAINNTPKSMDPIPKSSNQKDPDTTNNTVIETYTENQSPSLKTMAKAEGIIFQPGYSKSRDTQDHTTWNESHNFSKVNINAKKIIINEETQDFPKVNSGPFLDEESVEVPSIEEVLDLKSLISENQEDLEGPIPEKPESQEKSMNEKQEGQSQDIDPSNCAPQKQKV
ncbi:hypothetical protein PtB15_7B80 [Puccinia triticina]|nr:hypothetical protein PtB15_7B80 [Puccinia triticina]